MAFQEQPHFVLIPFMGQGHLIPMVDIARILAHRGVTVTMFTTPENFKRVESVIARAVSSGLQIQVIQLEFPAVEAGLPEGCECIDMLPSIESGANFFAATRMLQPSVEKWWEQLVPTPSCILADACHPWTSKVSAKFGIPRLVFHGFCCFSLLCSHILSKFKELNDVSSDSEYFVVPDLPHHIEMTKAQVGGIAIPPHPAWKQIQDEMREAEDSAFGVVANSFQELEPDYIAQYRKVKGKKVWCIGPVNLFNKETLDMAERGTKTPSSFDLEWLDLWEPKSVIYAFLGSLTILSTSQLIELGSGLEQSNHPFVWVIKDAPEEFKKWLLEEKFEDRIKQRGLLIHGWAPQVLILSHPSVGVFLTHCGWNSTIEGVSSGVAMITMPMFVEQFMNERLVVDVLKTGVKAGMERPIFMGNEETMGAQVSREDTKMAIEKVMDEEQGKMRRSRVEELGSMATKAMEEGGSSYLDITQLIQDVMDQVHLKSEPKAKVLVGGGGGGA